ncbi:hypothetical protein B0H67DRAFT_646644 [Lasiosphaeris hirsuta]|uniref:Uncharacterized protein n=1 Tax=Lasiosphaeris hirsuta TaxID=260670 RepID=A0AA40A8N6_9PEZI|nr:hypothetical protein B0H67DRAFT_646644 [Lasiosphaeris hirsuta]
MPPHSLAEWIVGQNIPNRKKTARKPVVKLEIDTDDERETDTVTVSYPRHGSTQRHKLSAKQVKFDKNAPTSSEEVNTSGSGPTDTDTSDDDQPMRRSSFKPGKSKSKTPVKTDALNAEQERAPEVIQVPADLNPHPTCTCLPCEAGRLILKSLGRTPNGNTKHDGTPDVPVESKKSKDKKPKECGCKEACGGDTAVAPASDSQSEPEQAKNKGKQQAKKDQGKDHGSSESQKKDKPNNGKKEAPKGPEVAASSAEPVAEMKPAPKAPSEHTYKLAHVIEDPVKDPYPNAYFDRASGFCRVYHGSSWGNPRGSPDPRRAMNQYAPPIDSLHPPSPYHSYPSTYGPPAYGPPPAIFRDPLAQQEPIRYAAYAHHAPQHIVYAQPPPQQIIYTFPPPQEYYPRHRPHGHRPSYQNVSPREVSGYPPSNQWAPAPPRDGYGIPPDLGPPQLPKSDPKPASMSPPKDNPATGLKNGSKAGSPPKTGSPAMFGTPPETNSPPKDTQENAAPVSDNNGNTGTDWGNGSTDTDNNWGGGNNDTAWGSENKDASSGWNNDDTGTGGSGGYGDPTQENNGNSGSNTNDTEAGGANPVGDPAKSPYTKGSIAKEAEAWGDVNGGTSGETGDTAPMYDSVMVPGKQHAGLPKLHTSAADNRDAIFDMPGCFSPVKAHNTIFPEWTDCEFPRDESKQREPQTPDQAASAAPILQPGEISPADKLHVSPPDQTSTWHDPSIPTEATWPNTCTVVTNNTTWSDPPTAHTGSTAWSDPTARTKKSWSDNLPSPKELWNNLFPSPKATQGSKIPPPEQSNPIWGNTLRWGNWDGQ